MAVGEELAHPPLEGSKGLAGPTGGLLKRVFDVIVAATAIIALLPVLLAIALLVRLAGPGAVVYSHERLGFGGRTFRCLKFRSMVVNSAEVLKHLLETDEAAREEWNATQKLRNDPRITPIGRILRVSSLDELPQLLNVLRGDMSLIGPRPIVRAETRHYGSDVALYFRARPGISGLWQVSGRSDVDYPKRVRLDVEYVRTWSFWKDIGIMLKTVLVVLSREGSR